MEVVLETLNFVHHHGQRMTWGVLEQLPVHEEKTWEGDP